MTSKTAHLLVRWEGFWVEGCDGLYYNFATEEIYNRDMKKTKYLLNRRILLAQSGERAHVAIVTRKLRELLLTDCESNETRLDLVAIGRRMSALFPDVNDSDFLIIDGANVGPQGCVTMRGEPRGGFAVYIDDKSVQGMGSGGDEVVEEFINLAHEITPPTNVEQVADLVYKAIREVAKKNRLIGGRIRVNISNGKGGWNKYI